MSKKSLEDQEPKSKSIELSDEQMNFAMQRSYEGFFGMEPIDAIVGDLRKQAKLDKKECSKVMSYIRAKIALLNRLDTEDEVTRQDQEVEKIVELQRILLEKQYPQMLGVLKHYEIDTQGAPTQKALEKGLTDEVLKKALKLKKPTLILIPPTTRQSKVDAINKHPAKGQHADTITLNLGDNNLWNGGKAETESKWRVSIVEGVQDVEMDPKIYDGKNTTYEMCKAWVEKYDAQGLDVINDADTYLILMMKSLSEGRPIDYHAGTVLNAKNQTVSSVVACGDWFNVQVRLIRVHPDSSSVGLRARALVGVEVSGD